MVKADVCIIGAGVMGAATAYWLSKNPKLKVVLIEQYRTQNDYCSSNDANRVFRYAYGKDVLYTQMAIQSLKFWRQLEEETGQTLLVPTNLLLLEGEDPDANKFNRDSHDTLGKLGLESERLGEEELEKRYPQFSARAGFVDPNAGVLLAAKVLSALVEQARNQGVRIIEECKATSLKPDIGPQVETTANTVSCEKIIVTAGPWTNSLRGRALPNMTPTRQQIVYFKPRQDLRKFQPPEFPIFFADQYYGLPAVGIKGVKVSHKNLPDAVDPDNASRTVDLEFERSTRDLCRKFIPELAEAPVHLRKVCLYDMTGNSDFVIGPDPEHSPVIYGYGFSGHGFKFAPLVGKLLAELAQDQSPEFDTKRFTPTTPHERDVLGPPY